MKDGKMKGVCCEYHMHGGAGFGILLVLIGVFLLLKETVFAGIPTWPAVLIAIGMYIIIKKLACRYWC